MKKFLPVLVLFVVLMVGAIAYASDPCPANCKGSGCDRYIDANKNGTCDLSVADMEGTFKDLKNHWAKNCVEKLVNSKIISGYPDGTIRPDNEVTHAEAVALLSKAAQLKPKNKVKLAFSDAAEIPSWLNDYLQAAVDYEVISENSFKPLKKVTRQEMAVMIVKAFELDEKDTAELPFKDLEGVSDSVKNSIGCTYKMKIILGYPDNSFKPEKSISRAEAFTIISNALDAKSKK